MVQNLQIVHSSTSHRNRNRTLYCTRFCPTLMYRPFFRTTTTTTIILTTGISIMSFNLTPDVMRSLALSMLGKTQEQQARMKLSNRESFFKQHLGSSTNVLCVMWSDLHLFSLLSKKESSYKGLKMFMIAHYFLYSYPRNSTQISSMFQICERYTRGKPLWDWVRKIQSLKAHKVKWLPHFGEPNSETFIITVDGTDCKI